MNEPLIRFERRGEIAILTLNRPQRHNSLIPPLLQALLASLEQIEAQQAIRAVILQANGRSFSTGGDVRAFYDNLGRIYEYANELVGLLNEAILAIANLHAPVIAAVHGQVSGGSLGLVLACDIVLIAPEARFTPFYGEVGFSPDGGWTAWLPEIIGAKRTAGILLTNSTIGAQQALDWGLANAIASAEDLSEMALEIAGEAASLEPTSLLHAKRLLNRNVQALADGLEAERSHFTQQIVTEEARRGMEKFLGITGDP